MKAHFLLLLPVWDFIDSLSPYHFGTGCLILPGEAGQERFQLGPVAPAPDKGRQHACQHDAPADPEGVHQPQAHKGHSRYPQDTGENHRHGVKISAVDFSGKPNMNQKVAQVTEGPSLKAQAESCIGKTVEELIALIGEPQSSDYAPSCLNPGVGEDGNLYYEGFTVYTYKEDGVEEVVDVE